MSGLYHVYRQVCLYVKNYNKGLTNVTTFTFNDLLGWQEII